MNTPTTHDPKNENLDEKTARFREMYKAAEAERDEANRKALREAHRAAEAVRLDAEAKVAAEHQKVRDEIAAECGFVNAARDRRKNRIVELIRFRTSRLGPGERAEGSRIDLTLNAIEIEERQESALLDEMVEMTMRMRTAPPVAAAPLELPRDVTTGADDVLVLFTSTPVRWEIAGHYVRPGTVVPAEMMAGAFGDALRAFVAERMRTRPNTYEGAWLVPVREGLAGACKATGLGSDAVIEVIAGRPREGVPGASLLAYRWAQSVQNHGERNALEAIASNHASGGAFRRVETNNLRAESHHETLQRIRMDHPGDPHAELAAWWTEVEGRAKVTA